MRQVRVTFDVTMEIPNDWQILGMEEPEPGSILVDGQRYEPGLTWMKVTPTEDGLSESEPADDEAQFMFMERITSSSESVDCL